MVSKQGTATISSYNCFKQSLTKEEIKRTGLKPTMPQEEIDKVLEKSDPFKNVQSKVGEKMHMGASTAVVEIREQIAKEKREKELNMIMHSSQQAIVNA